MSSLLDSIDLPAAQERLGRQTAPERIAWAVEALQQRVVLTSSFGAQAAVSLHLATQVWPEIPVIFIDTGYHFPETLAFVETLTARLKLNLHIYHSPLTPTQFESTHGKLWEQGVDGITRYNEIVKVGPMRRALADLGAWGWITGLRRQQAATRHDLGFLGLQDGRLKIHPILDWTSQEVGAYLAKHDLPFHPLWEQGYVSIGDIHSTRKLTDGMTEEETRFGGLTRECGIHLGTEKI